MDCQSYAATLALLWFFKCHHRRFISSSSGQHDIVNSDLSTGSPGACTCLPRSGEQAAARGLLYPRAFFRVLQPLLVHDHRSESFKPHPSDEGREEERVRRAGAGRVALAGAAGLARAHRAG